VDHLLFTDPERGRLVLNVGGIANVTALPPGGSVGDVTAFDTGPGNMVVDALMTLLTGGEKHMDEGGAWARKGTVDRDLAGEFLEEPYFRQTPPKAAGREEFGRAYAERFLARSREKGLSPATTVATATWLTAAAVHGSYERFVAPRCRVEDVIVSGGGAHNVALLEDLSDLFEGARVVPSDYYGLDVDAKEAAAFAILGHLALEGKAGNLPGVTGATHPVFLGTLTPGGDAE
jgi:anhydro-N-acetylmuramic acid kinase